MKKLMFGAAIAATSMVFAATPEGQVYDVCLSIKSTKAASAKINNKTNPIAVQDDSNDTVIYRTQTSYSWKGLIWGCDCNAIDGVWEEVNEVLETGYSTIKGCILWDTKAKEAVYIGNGADITDVDTAAGNGFGWEFINAIDKKGNKVEGVWSMTQAGELCDDPEDPIFEFKGAGFGTLCVVTEKDDDGLLVPQCTSYIKSISGNFAGWMIAPDATSVKNPSGCTFCGYDGGSSTCEPAEAWEFCNCLATADAYKTAAYGTWSVKYNSSLSKKLSKPVTISDKGLDNVIVSIRDAYNFNSLPLVAAKIAAIENTFWQLDPTGCDELETALAAANKAVTTAEAAVEAVKYENLKAAEVAAQANVNLKAAAYDKADDAVLQYKEEQYTANAAYEKALYNQTNVNWTITYTNVVQIEKTASGVGCVKLTAAIEELSAFDLVKMESSIPGHGIRTCTSWAACTALVKEYTDATAAAKEALVKADAALVSAKADLVTAAAALEVANDALTAAQNNLANITILQYEAARDLEEAETAQAAAQAAYDDAGCGED